MRSWRVLWGADLDSHWPVPGPARPGQARPGPARPASHDSLEHCTIFIILSLYTDIYIHRFYPNSTLWIHGIVVRYAASTRGTRVRSLTVPDGILKKKLIFVCIWFGQLCFWFLRGLAMPNHMQINAKPQWMFRCKPKANQLTKLLSNKVHTKHKETSIAEPIFIHLECKSIMHLSHIIIELIDLSYG
jgi:hypothetical protein